MSIKQNGGVFGRNPTFNDVTIEGDLIINGEVFTGLDFQGSWNASTNSPALASSVGTNGEFYIVSIAGTTDLNGITNWGIGDWAIFNGTVWQRVEGGADGNFNDLTANSLLVNGTATMDGLTVAGTDYGQPLLSVDNGSTGGHGAYIDTGGFTTSHYALSVNRNNGKQALRVDGLGDVSFYEDTGTTAKMVWKASDECLGIGTSSPASTLEIAKNDQTNGATLSITNSFDGSGWDAGDTIGTINFRVDDFSATEKIRGQIKVFDDTSGSSTFPSFSAMSFSTALSNTLSERMRIDSSGNVGIGTSSPSASALLDVQSTTKGVRFPNMTTTQKNAMADVAGIQVFDTTLGKMCFNTGSAWETITSS